jgi:aspartyl-tRNA synthetase
MGWVHRRRDHGGVIFVDLRDREGIVQVVFNPEAHADSHREAHRIRSEFVLALKGTVRKRPEGMENPELPTGQIEVLVNTLEILKRRKHSSCSMPMWRSRKTSAQVPLPRFAQTGAAAQHHPQEPGGSRDAGYFNSQGFIEVETPMLAKSTPEGPAIT